MSGYELAVALRERSKLRALRLFALTGYDLAEDLKRSADAGFERHCVKLVALTRPIDALRDIPAERRTAAPLFASVMTAPTDAN